MKTYRLHLLALLVTLAPGAALAQTGHWSFDEGSGTTAASSVAGAPSGELSANDYWVAGASGSAVYTPPTGNIVFPASVGQLGEDDFTIEFWIKTTDTSYREIAGNRGPQDSHGSYVDFRLNAGRIEYSVDGGGPTLGYAHTLSTALVNDGQWHRITGVRDGATISLYVDSALQATGTAADDVVANVSNGFPFILGANDVSFMYGSFFDGAFDELKVWDRALTADEINPPTTTALLNALVTTLDGYAIDHGIRTALKAKVTAAQADVTAADLQSAIGVMGAFKNQVAAQSGKKLTAAQATELTNRANQIISTLQ